MRAALASLIACLILLQAPASSSAQPARGRSGKAARGAQTKRAKAQNHRARLHRLGTRGSRPLIDRSKTDGARALKRSNEARSSKRRRDSKQRSKSDKQRSKSDKQRSKSDKQRSRGGLRQKISEVKSLLVEAGVEKSEAGRAAEHASLGLPSEASPEKPKDYLLAGAEYVVSYNRDRKVPNWISWKFSAGDLGDVKRTDNFRRDARIPESWKPATTNDYGGSGMTRGHLVSSGARTSSKKANKSTFLLSNVVPQSVKSNVGPWHRLEVYLRNQVQNHGKDVYLSAGPIFEGNKTRTIGENKIAVPDALWKVAVIVPKGTPPGKIGKDARTLSVIIPNDGSTKRSGTFPKYRVKPKQIEKKTGLRFFGHLPEKIRSALRDRLDRQEIPKKEMHD